MAALLALLSSFTWGTADFLGGILSKRRNAIAVIGGSQPFGLIAITIVALAFNKFWFNEQIIIYGIFAGLIGMLALMAYYQALATGSMGIVAPIGSLGVLVPLVYAYLDGDKPTTMQNIGIAAAIIGVVLASGPEFRGGTKSAPILLALGSAVFFGFVVLFMAKGGQINAPATVVVMRVSQVSVMLTLALVLRTLGGLKREDVPLLAATGSMDAIANVFFTTAASIGMLSIVSVLGSLFPIATGILAWWFLKERLIPIQYIGIVVTMAGVVAITSG
jgi:drug/metabolite transporter (DMT)-like permease